MVAPIVYRGVCGLLCSLLAQSFAIGAADRETNSKEINPAGAWEQLMRIQRASERLNYSGIFIYQTGGVTKSSRITHLVDGSGTHEKLEMLDGKAREYIRHNEEVWSYRPDDQAIVIEKRHIRNRFPSLSNVLGPELNNYYLLKSLPEERVSGRLCQGLELEARDNLRYSYRLWADKQTGLLLKTEIFDEQGVTVEQIVFTEVRIGAGVPGERQKLKPGFGNTAHWKILQHTVAPANLTAEGWQIRNSPPGFRRIHELRRSMPGQPEAGQIVLSDGMSAVSVFIQAYREDQTVAGGLMHQGAIHVFARRIGDYWITVVGEVPVRTIQMLAESIEFKPVK